jgi:hypothetical protein
MEAPVRGIVVTPYCKEPREVIERCILSVASQTEPVHHVLIADGYPQECFDGRSELGLTHLRVRPCQDWGNTPRRTAMYVYHEAPFITFLDADNEYDGDHIQTCLWTAEQNPGCDYVASRRRFSGRGILDEAKEDHVDMNCFLLFPQCYGVAMAALKSAPDMYNADRAMYAALKFTGKRVAHSIKRSVLYSVNPLPPLERHK